MTWNPVAYTERVVEDFLRYQLTAYPFADRRLHAQLEQLLNLADARRTPLLKGPYVTLSNPFREGANVVSLIDEGLMHPRMARVADFPSLYGHQEQSVRSLAAGRDLIVSTGTGSGKTESFLYPIISRCLELEDAGDPPGIRAIIIYPMNALAEDQLGRMRELLCGTGVTFGMYVGSTPQSEREVSGERLAAGTGRTQYRAKLAQLREQGSLRALLPPEELASRERMRDCPPRILLTNVKQLELLLTRWSDGPVFEGARLEHLVLDEAHTFRGAQGAETALLVRRLIAMFGAEDGPRCIGTSATIAEPGGDQAPAKQFASRIFGVDPANVEVVTESYERSADWAVRSEMVDTPAPANATELLARTIAALDQAETDPAPLSELVEQLIGRPLGDGNGDWHCALYERLRTSAVAFAIAEWITKPQEFEQLATALEPQLGRPIEQPELLAWLALGSMARSEGRPLMRPVMHAFVHGIDGAVVTFADADADAGDEWRGFVPTLWLSAVEAAEAEESLARLAVSSCTTCGQHYFEHFVRDLTSSKEGLGGGLIEGDEIVHPALAREEGGDRVVLLDALAVASDADEDTTVPEKGWPIWMCRFCGGLHRAERETCLADGCGRSGGLVRMVVVSRDPDKQGVLTRCVACDATGRTGPGGRYREPARPVRATTVADVFVLAQNMLAHAERERLLVFADNRQDAAFQAGWMRDHARRFRLRRMMYDALGDGPQVVGELAAQVSDELDASDEMSRILAPEVWKREPKEKRGSRHADERRYYLRIQVLRELSMAPNQRLGLEPWGRIAVRYSGLDETLPFVERWAAILGCSREQLLGGVEGYLDLLRRRRCIRDKHTSLYSRLWHESSEQVQSGYMIVQPNVPNGMVLRADGDHDSGRIKPMLAVRGHTRAMQLARRWGVPKEQVGEFLEELWKLLTSDLNLLVPGEFTFDKQRNGSYGRLKGTAGAFQLDSEQLIIEQHSGVYRCTTCRRGWLRDTPGSTCLAWGCDGITQFESEAEDNYDLRALDGELTMVLPRDHSAQVPHEDRERIERAFKDPDDRSINTIVATPTLEMGVDIGALDAVLMRNVPPLPANYWQRAGRAGRRHRLAVNLVYARPTSHDRAYFDEPLKLLGGSIDAPSLNLDNQEMVEKHARATVLGELHRIAAKHEDEALLATIDAMIPRHVRDWLFTPAGDVRQDVFDVSPLGACITEHRDRLVAAVERAFERCWPDHAARVVEPERLRRIVDTMPYELQAHVSDLHRRLHWALRQLGRLNEIRQQRGDLDPDNKALENRCQQLLRRLRGTRHHDRAQAQGRMDDTPLSILAAEGFLPGYGLDTGRVVATAEIPRTLQSILREFELQRPSGVALREFAPGNMLYANGNRFVARRYHLEAEGEPDEIAGTRRLSFQIDLATESAREIGASSAGGHSAIAVRQLDAVPICDVDLRHASMISDEEEFRFQMPVVILGSEVDDQHDGGTAYGWGALQPMLRKELYLRLVNAGAKRAVDDERLGYPICTICGQSRSPFASDAEIDKFTEQHTEWCGKPVSWIGFYDTVAADTITIRGLDGTVSAWSLGEALRMGATRILDMELEDLQLLVEPVPGDEDHATLHLYDPMPGGSGLLERIIERWGEVLAAGHAVCESCAGCCDRSCIDCLQTFRNAHYHRHLDRHAAIAAIATHPATLERLHDISPGRAKAVDPDASIGVNDVERELRQLMIDAELGVPDAQTEIPIPGGTPPSTWPDFFYEHPDIDDEGNQTGVCVYLDGMSRRLHGNERRLRIDNLIREQLEEMGHDVIRIPVSDLGDAKAMRRHVKRIAKSLERKADLDAVMTAVRTGSARVPLTAENAGDPSSLEPATDELLDEAVRPLVREAHEAGCPLPIAGYEHADNGQVWLLEAAWPDQRVAIVVDRDEDRDARLAGANWTLRHVDQWDAAELVAALRGRL